MLRKLLAGINSVCGYTKKKFFIPDPISVECVSPAYSAVSKSSGLIIYGHM
jgi:hypothetical protein